jgi:hypothetical protein
MRWVQHASHRPARCAVLPFVGNSNTQRGFIDTGQELPGWDPHIYVSVEAVEEMGRMVGLVRPAELGTVRRERDEATARVAELELELARARGELDAVGVLRRAGFSAQAAATVAKRRPKRKPPAKVNA